MKGHSAAGSRILSLLDSGSFMGGGAVQLTLHNINNRLQSRQRANTKAKPWIFSTPYLPTCSA